MIKNHELLIFISAKYNQPYYYNPQNNTTVWLSIEDQTLLREGQLKTADNTSLNLPPKWIHVQSKIYQKNYFYNTQTNISQWQIPSEVPKLPTVQQILCSKIRPLKWTGNSCYIDSTIFALFINPTPFSEYILNTPITQDTQLDNQKYTCGNTKEESLQNRTAIQTELRNIVQSIHGQGPWIKNVTQLRKLFKHCNQIGEGFCDKDFHDAGEVLTYLLSILPPSDFRSVRLSTYASNNLTSNPDLTLTTQQQLNLSVVLEVPVYTLEELPKNISTNISSFLTQKDDTQFESSSDYYKPTSGPGKDQVFKRKITQTEVLSSPILVFRLHRNAPIYNSDYEQTGTNIIETSITPEETIILPASRQIFDLSAITLYYQQHYVCYYLCDKEWYFYNDTAIEPIEKIGSYDELLNSAYKKREKKTNITVQTYGTNYYYTRRETSVISPLQSPQDIEIVVLTGPEAKSREPIVNKYLLECFGHEIGPREFTDKFVWYFAERKGEILGFLTLKNKSEIWNLCTHPIFRGQGIARKIIMAVVQYICDQGINIPRLYVSKTKSSYAKLISYYQKLGFTIEEDHEPYDIMKYNCTTHLQHI